MIYCTENPHNCSSLFLVVEGDKKSYFAQDMKGAAMQSQEIPEWKKATFGGKGGSYGKKTSLSIIEQRESLPIFKLKEELVKVLDWFVKLFCLLKNLRDLNGMACFHGLVSVNWPILKSNSTLSLK